MNPDTSQVHTVRFILLTTNARQTDELSEMTATPHTMDGTS